jgi:hypothetical protein
MANQQKTKKNLARGIALLATLGAFLGLTSLPAVAEDWDIEVYVINTSNDCNDPISQPSWSPDPTLTYVANQFDLNINSPNRSGLLPFYFGLGLLQGWDNCLGINLPLTGEIVASVTGLDAELSMAGLDCTLEALCDPEVLRANGNIINGTIDASLASTTGKKSGKLTVVWTPEG